ncbi:matrix metalloproteinase-24 [Trichonephila inaurata madagascariensis]|uniref:Matrix metalloproteinase-24 n=1 Tax=Trichonephila inaurata madagascariensis TaxID=2747483 RepID=A0A8X6IE76_9ARAC|nr:matrix metalloproteinase-24 [Trichonephila inaurata madagascariensis]
MMDLCRFQFHLLHAFAACVIFVHFNSMTTTAAPVISSEIQAMMYLQKYGYMNESSSNSASLISEQAVSSAIKDFQRFAGLAETGELDNTTLNMMNMPRCGVRDKVGHSGSARRKRYALQGSKWRVTDLTYRISKYPRRLKDKQKVDKEIAKAFKVWSDVTNLKFINTDKGRVHIDVRFEEGEHGDGERFDGPGRTLAHAFFPQYGGDAHFDDEEKWTINQYYGTNLFQVAAHEFGHSLGLSHSDVKASLMAPFYRGYEPSFSLDEDDILGIQALYGRPRRESSATTPGYKPQATPDYSGGSPDLCQDAAINAATTTEDGRTYVFKGDYYWEIKQTGIADGYPRKISDDWGGLPGNLDAALTWTNGKTFFFKKNEYWRFRNKKMDSGYPKSISVGFEGIPNSIDTAFVWSGNGKTYFFKGANYWRFDSRSEPPVSSRYPQSISNWEGLPNNIDAALQWVNQKTYFFKGRNYYRFNDRLFSVDKADPPFPRSTSVWWFDCQAQSASNEDMTKASLNGGEKHPIYIGDDTNITSTRVPGDNDYVDSDVVDGSEKQDVDLQQSDDEVATPFPQKGALDANSASILSYSCLLWTLLSFTIHAQRWRVL